MKSAQFKRYGGSDVIEINQTTHKPTLTAANVLVEIKAAGINPIDWKIREGYMQQMIPLQFPSTLGMVFSGVIRQVGEGGVISSVFKQYDSCTGESYCRILYETKNINIAIKRGGNAYGKNDNYNPESSPLYDSCPKGKK